MDSQDIILPDDFETSTPEEEINEQPSETTETPTVEETQDETTQEQPKIKLKYNHQEQEYSLDDVVPLAQKGLNYDKVVEKLQALESDTRLSKYDKVMQLSNLYGMSDDDLLSALYNQYFEATAESQGLTAEQVKKEWELNQKEESIKAKEQTMSQQDEQSKMYNKFFETFPNVKIEDISKETLIRVENGMDLTTAYIMQQNQDLQNKMKILEQNQANAKAAPVKGVTAHGSDDATPEDPFLVGFNSY